MAGSVRDPPPPTLDHRRQLPSPLPSPSRIGGRFTATMPSSASASASSTASQRVVVPRTPPATPPRAKKGETRPMTPSSSPFVTTTPSTAASTPAGDAAPRRPARSAATAASRTPSPVGRDVADLHVRIVSSNLPDGGAAAHGGDHGGGGVSGDSALVHQLLEVRHEDLLRREEEMWHVARTFGVPPARWNGSRLYQCYQHEMKERAERNKYHSAEEPQHRHHRQKPVVLFLDPVAFCCREKHLSSVFRWSPWLGDMMQAYLRTGILTVHKEATGDDWLLCCEFFSVLYQPSQVVFETLEAYQNVSSWSDYLSKRCDLAEWVADHVLRRRESVFVVTHAQDNGWSVEVDQLPRAATGFVDAKAALALTDFFHDDDHPVDRETRQVRMRADFCGYLEHVMSHVHCRFDMELVTLTNQVQRFAPRAVLRVRMLIHPPPPPVSQQPKKTRSGLPFPLDELVAEDLHSGRLESLVKKVDARNPSSSEPTESPHGQPRVVSTGSVPSTKAVEAGIAPAAVAGDEAQAQNHSMAMASVKAQQTLKDGLPFNVIRTISTGEGNQSVTSALTGPFLFDEDGIMREPSEFYDAAVVAAASSSWMSRNLASISGTVKALVDDDTTKSPDVDLASRDRKDAGATAAAPKVADSNVSTTHEKKPEADSEQWDWLTNLCQYSSSFLSQGMGQSPLPGQADKVAADEATLKKEHESKRSAKLVELQTKAAESRSHKIPGGNRIDAHQEEIRVVSVHRVVEADRAHTGTVAAIAGAAAVPATPPQRAHTPEAARDNLSRSTESSNGGRDRPEPSANMRNRSGYESQASSTVSASLPPKSDRRNHDAQKRVIPPKRRALKGFFRRHKAEV